MKKQHETLLFSNRISGVECSGFVSFQSSGFVRNFAMFGKKHSAFKNVRVSLLRLSSDEKNIRFYFVKQACNFSVNKSEHYIILDHIILFPLKSILKKIIGRTLQVSKGLLIPSHIQCADKVENQKVYKPLFSLMIYG